MLKDFNLVIQKDLSNLKDEIKSFGDENMLWNTSGELKNSAGHLCLHICGNLRHFIGHVLGKTGYKRNRSYEFSASPISSSELLAEIDKTQADVTSVLNNLSEEVLDSIYPVIVFKKEMTTRYFLIHLLGHLNYHLGQINSLRRVL